MRIHESGIGLASLTAAQNPQGMQSIGPGPDGQIGPRPIHIGFKHRMGGPRPPKQAAVIDVIGSSSQNLNRAPAPRENVIQVMTADRREYSRTVQPPMQMQFNLPPEEFYNHEEQDAFNYGYEPTQDSQWDPQQQQAPWAPGEIKQLTGLNQPPPNIQQIRPLGLNVPPPHMMGNPQMIPPLMGQHMPMQIKQEMDDKRDMRGRMGGRDMRDDRRYEDRKRMRERSSSRDKDLRKTERRDDRPRTDRDRYARESSSRRRSKSREKKRSRSREKSRRSRSKERKSDDKDRSRRDDKGSTSSSKRSSSVAIKEEKS